MRDTAPVVFAGSSTILSDDKSLAFILLQIDLLSLTNMMKKRLLEHFSLKPGKSTDFSRAMLFGEQSIASLPKKHCFPPWEALLGSRMVGFLYKIKRKSVPNLLFLFKGLTMSWLFCFSLDLHYL